ncbi:MAG: wax ester/triacylglycerol synthase family O-acyltransferase [Lysobacterales bacterium]
MSDKPAREPISKVDTAWLRMEQPTNLMMINGIIIMEEQLDYEALLDTVEQRFLAFRRFRQKAVDRTRGAYWEFDEDFDVRWHVRRTALPGLADREELELLVSDLASTALDHSRPLWQIQVVENYVEGPVLVARIHHCIADGIALVQLFLSLTDPTPAGRKGVDAVPAPDRAGPGGFGLCIAPWPATDRGRRADIAEPGGGRQVRPGSQRDRTRTGQFADTAERPGEPSERTARVT